MWLLTLILASGLASVESKFEWVKNDQKQYDFKSQNTGRNDFVETVHAIFMNHLGKLLYFL